ncbi:hypothetical protein QR680_001637 [Steinernema hermaphroditum]|uniref:Uncharacterized protein n=1 Tax=Steinernema hermaphroditum TaxID=289476 RepID=A0AA39GZ57_9BILA|nr:hypothetical protein QR680_001637 [Steinernema hermaphroditum]
MRPLRRREFEMVRMCRSWHKEDELEGRYIYIYSPYMPWSVNSVVPSSILIELTFGIKFAEIRTEVNKAIKECVCHHNKERQSTDFLVRFMMLCTVKQLAFMSQTRKAPM